MESILEFMFLGTSSGVPTLQRNVSSLVVKKSNSKPWYLVDCGEATQHQLQRTPYSLVQLGGIFITHAHGDHCYGLPGLLASASMAGRTAPLKIIGPKEIEEFVRTTMRLTDAHMTYELEFVASESLSGEQFGEEFVVSSSPLSHRVPCHAYVFEEHISRVHLNTQKLLKLGVPKGPLWGRLAKGEKLLWKDSILDPQDYTLDPKRKRKIIVGGDNDSPELLKECADSADVLIHEATYTEDIRQKVGPTPQHSSAECVSRFAHGAKIPNLVLTHFSARYHHTELHKRSAISEIEEEASKYYSQSLFLARDFDLFTLDREGVLSLQPVSAS